MNAISLKLPQPMLDRLEQEARSRRRSKSAVIRDCLHEVLMQPKRNGMVSCHDLAPHLAGSVSGPRDLARNKDHYLRLAMRKELARERERSR